MRNSNLMFVDVVRILVIVYNAVMSMIKVNNLKEVYGMLGEDLIRLNEEIGRERMEVEELRYEVKKEVVKGLLDIVRKLATQVTIVIKNMVIHFDVEKEVVSIQFDNHLPVLCCGDEGSPEEIPAFMVEELSFYLRKGEVENRVRQELEKERMRLVNEKKQLEEEKARLIEIVEDLKGGKLTPLAQVNNL